MAKVLLPSPPSWFSMLFCMALMAVITRVVENTPTSTPSSVSPERSLGAAMEGDGGRREGKREHPAKQTDPRRLEQELQKNGAPPCPERLAQPDLAGALGHGDEHDVHDPDAAHEQGQPGDEESAGGDHGG